MWNDIAQIIKLLGPTISISLAVFLVVLIVWCIILIFAISKQTDKVLKGEDKTNLFGPGGLLG